LRRVPLCYGLVAAVASVLGSSLAAQTPPPPPEEPAHEGRLQFAVSVETVTLDVVVVDKKGRFVPGLTRESFEILEDGLPQDLSFFTAEFTPVTTLLLLDTSSSIRSNLSAIQTAAYLFSQNLSEGDKARIGLFNSKVRFGVGYTDAVSTHLAMLKTMKAEGSTALYDALLEALHELDSVEGRKSLLVFTDGDDAGPAHQGSRASIDEVIEAAKQSEVTIYAVGFTGWGPEGSESVNRPFLATLAEATGGRPFFPKKVEEVKKAFAEVQQDLHRHYRMAYAPNLAAGVGGWRNIEVKVKTKPGLFVRTRQGYYTRTPSE
jgi:Ca-activated chloride channel family protein